MQRFSNHAANAATEAEKAFAQIRIAHSGALGAFDVA